MGFAAEGTSIHAFSQNLTRSKDWSLSAGYERRYSAEAGTGDAWDNAVFVTIDRAFSWVP